MTNKILLKNIVLIVVFVFAMVGLCSLALNLITGHGRSVVVPDMVGLQLEDAQYVASKSHLRIEVEDSTFVSVVDRGAVFMQEPAAGSSVKKGRHIRLIVNTVNPRKVPMPNVVDCPLRQAVSDLSSKGFRVGHLYYVTGDDDRVQAQLLNGRNIAPGTSVNSGSVIDLRVGLDPNYNSVTVPSVMGKKGLQATKELQEHSLNVKLSYDSSVVTREDKVKAVVIQQTPAPETRDVNKGCEVRLLLSLNTENNEN